MDLMTVDTIRRPGSRDAIGPVGPGDAFLGGGTWLFSEPQRHLTRLIDLAGLGWAPLAVDEAGLEIAATCTVAELAALEARADWTAAPLFGLCCRAFLASFKIWTMATVGGNLCMGLPAGPMISLTAALDGTCLIWAAAGGERRLPVEDFVRGPLDVALAPGDLLRGVRLPAAALRRRFAFRRASLSTLGRSGVLLIGTLDGDGGFALTVTAATRRPVKLRFASLPGPGDLAARIDAAIPEALWHDDIHGRPDWRRRLTQDFAVEIRDELAGGAAWG